MKTQILLIVLFIYGISYSQTDKREKRSDTIKEKLNLSSKELNEPLILDTLVNSEKFALNSYGIMRKLSSIYLSDISDLSYSKAYVVLDNSEGKLFLGGTFNLNTKENTYFLTIGAKANVKDGFSEYFKQSKINNDIGFSGKLIINFGESLWHNKANTDQKKKILNNRKLVYAQKLIKLDDELGNYNRINNILEADESKEAFLKKKDNEKAKELIDEENEFIVDNKLFNQTALAWTTLDVYVPVTQTEYNVSKDIYSAFSQKSFYPFSVSVSANYWLFIPATKKIRTRFFTNRIYKSSSLFSVKVDLVNNNSILADQIKMLSFDEYETYSPTVNNLMYLVKTDSKDIFIGDFERFLTPKLSAKYVFQYPFKNFSIGARVSVEKSFGKVNFLDWKIGIPFSFNDDDNNTKINFELVTQNVMNIRSTGINIGLPINKF